MAYYITRIELHYAVSTDYARLHDEMEKEGFLTTIPMAGTIRKLPEAEYYRESSLDCESILNSAKRAIAGTGKVGCALVSETINIMGSGLFINN